MNKNQFNKKLNDLGPDSKEKIEEMLGSKVDSGEELVEKFEKTTPKIRKKIIASVGAGLLSVLVLAGFAKCMNNKGELSDAVSQETTIAENTPVITPAFTTEAIPGTTAQISGTTKTPETTGVPTSETTGAPTTEAPTTETTEAPTTETTEAPTTETAEPEVPEDLPGDADGYQYPVFFRNLVHERVVGQNALSNHAYHDEISEAEPEILFVERGVSCSREMTPIIVYSRYNINGKYLYARFAFEIKSADYRLLGFASMYDSYEAYINAIVTAMQAKCNPINAVVSELEFETDSINSQLNETFAKFFSSEFVDAEINCVRGIYIPKDLVYYYEVSGFGYDKDGKAYSFIAEIDTVNSYTPDGLIDSINKGELTKDGTTMFDVTLKAIDAVFTKEIENQN